MYIYVYIEVPSKLKDFKRVVLHLDDALSLLLGVLYEISYDKHIA